MKYKLINFKFMFLYAIVWIMVLISEIFLLVVVPYLYGAEIVHKTLYYSIVGFLSLATSFVAWFFSVYKYLGKICIKKDVVYLKKDKKVYSLFPKETLILNIYFEQKMKGAPFCYVAIRKKGEKEEIPIRIEDSKIIMLLLDTFTCVGGNRQGILNAWKKSMMQKGKIKKSL